ARAAIDEVARTMHAALAARAREAMVLGGPPTEAPGRPTVLRAVYLVSTPGLDAFEEEAGALALRHAALDLRAELIGPWPAYHFTRLELRSEEDPLWTTSS